GAALCCRYIPVLRRGGNQHRARGGAGLAQLSPARMSRARTAGILNAVQFHVDGGLFDSDLRPVRIHLVGEYHRERGFDALPDLRTLAERDAGFVRRNADKDIERRFARRSLRRRRLNRKTEDQPSAKSAREMKEAAPANLNRVHCCLPVRASRLRRNGW